MKAMVEIEFVNGTKEKFAEGDFWSHQFKNDLEDRNTEFIKIGECYINKKQINFVKIEKENEQ